MKKKTKVLSLKQIEKEIKDISIRQKELRSREDYLMECKVSKRFPELKSKFEGKYFKEKDSSSYSYYKILDVYLETCEEYCSEWEHKIGCKSIKFKINNDFGHKVEVEHEAFYNSHFLTGIEENRWNSFTELSKEEFYSEWEKVSKNINTISENI